MERRINLDMINQPGITPILAISPKSQPPSRRDSQPDNRPLAMPFGATPLRLPSIAHIHPSAGQQQVARDAVMLVTLRDDASAMMRVRQVDP